MKEEDNRWARPTMDDCKWTTADGLPAWMCEEGIQRGLSMQAENPVLVLVGSDPMLHRVDEGDGNPPASPVRLHPPPRHRHVQGV